MNRLVRFLYILVLPRLPRLGPEDVAGTAEYYNRLARRDEAASNPPDAWMRRIPKRLENCGAVLQEILDIPDNLPGQVLAKAECVIVFPSVLKLAFGMGKDYGRGAMVCRKGKEFNGRWGAPAMYALEGDSLGMQIGGESTD